MRLYCVTSGTVAGREHVRLGRNNQDAIGLAVGDEHVVAVVADGCSSARGSEVGAQLAAAWIAAHAPRYFARGAEGEDASLVARLFEGLLAFLGDTARALSASGVIEPSIVGDHLLFTVLGAWVDEARVVVFGQGDGVFAVNGRVTRLENAEASPDAPRYLGYALVEPRALEANVARGGPAVHFVGDASSLVSLVLATDGAIELEGTAEEPLPDGDVPGGLAAIAADDRLVANPTLLHKRLVKLGAVHGRLRDDTTVVLVRRALGPALCDRLGGAS